MADRKKYKYGLDKLRKKKKTEETFVLPLPPTVWKPRVARPSPSLGQEGSGPGGALTPKDKQIIKDHKARLIALREGSRPVKARPMKGIPRNLPPELAKPKKPTRKPTAKSPRKPTKKSTTKSSPATKVGVRTGNNNLSKLVKAINK